MTIANDRMALFVKTVKARGQARVARELGYSASAVNQVLRGNYNGNLDRILEKVAETYGGETVDCPIMGTIPLRRCSQEKKIPFSAASPLRVQLHRACQTCGRR